MFAKVISFPYVKLQERTGKKIKAAYNKFEEFIFKRVDEKLFDNLETVELLIEDFESITENPEISVDFNQRRDKFATYPIALVCCLLSGQENLIRCIKSIPDLWSFRSLIFQELYCPKISLQLTISFIAWHQFSNRMIYPC